MPRSKGFYKSLEDMTQRRIEVRRYLNKAIAQLGYEKGEPANRTDLANALNIPLSTLQYWWDGKAAPSGPYLAVLARRFGPEIYSIVGEMPSTTDPVVIGLALIWDDLPEEVREELRERAIAALKGNTPNEHTEEIRLLRGKLEAS